MDRYQIDTDFINYVIKSYVPELLTNEKKMRCLNMNLFREAMMHISTKINPTDKTYERLEYLGDAIFHMIVTIYFYNRYSDETEGFLTKLRIRIERGDSMVALSIILKLDQYIQIDGIVLNDHILEDVFEAFIGAFYLNFGMKYVYAFVIKLIEQHKDLAALIHYDDNYKDLLLRYFHQMKWSHPKYIDQQHHNHYNRLGKFESCVKDVDNQILGRGIARSKQQAEQSASKNALITLGIIVGDEIDPDWLSKIEVDEKQEQERKKSGKKPMSVYNVKNKLLKKANIVEIFRLYGMEHTGKKTFNLKLFHEAMTHRSYLSRKSLTSEDKELAKQAVKLQPKSNERLRLLGDTIIHFVIGEHLFQKYRAEGEGFLTRLRCKLENRNSLFYLAQQCGIGAYALVSQNIEVLHGRNNVNIISRTFEAFIGAAYIELGLVLTREFIIQVIRIELDIEAVAEQDTNYKDLILQLYNRHHWGYPEYRIIKEYGPDHAKTFVIGIYLNGKLMGQGTGSSKRSAQQLASKEMYERLVNQTKIIEKSN